MTDTRGLAHQLIDQLPETQVWSGSISRIDYRSREGCLGNAPLDDEPETEEDNQAAAEAGEWIKKHGGKGIPHAAAIRRLGLE